MTRGLEGVARAAAPCVRTAAGSPSFEAGAARGARGAATPVCGLVARCACWLPPRPAYCEAADGTLLIGDQAEGSVADYHQYTISFSEVRWLRLDPVRGVTLGTWVQNPDLSKVEEVGYFDVIPGSGATPKALPWRSNPPRPWAGGLPSQLSSCGAPPSAGWQRNSRQISSGPSAGACPFRRPSP